MCGIAGFELTGADAETAAVLLGRLARRGPDGGWFTKAAPYGFVQTRLAIVDLSERVKYPLRSETGELYLLFNGEIYEHERHRRELQRRGHHFATGCDAEVVLHGYEEWGGDVFRRLDGMFALALFHVGSGDLVLTRDGLGIKPLVHTMGGRFAFSSDALSLVAAGLADGEVDESMLAEFLAFHYVLPPGTGFSSLRQLNPGETLRRSRDGGLTFERWRSRPFTQPRQSGGVDVEQVGEAFDRSVRRQLSADVPVGVFLSSGLDSSLVLDSAVRAGAQPLAFTIGFPGLGDYDEVSAASRLTRDLGITHEVGELSGGFADTVSLVAAAFDEPFADASAIATVQLARLARKRVTVALSGTGGDDLFGGYYRHRAQLYGKVLRYMPTSLRSLLTRLAGPRGSERSSRLMLARSYVARLAALHGSEPVAQYLQLVSSASSSRVHAGMRTTHDRLDISALEGAFLRSEQTSVLRQIQAFELKTYLPGDLLIKEDRATMATGLEARVPLLGSELVELAERSSDAQKVGLFTGKRLLRNLARSRLPGYVTRARKRGFAVPLSSLFAGPWRAESIDWFADSSSSFVDGQAVARLLRTDGLPATDAWTLAMIVGWERSVADARKQAAAAGLA